MRHRVAEDRMASSTYLEKTSLELPQLALHGRVERSVGERPHGAESRDEFPFCLRLSRGPGRGLRRVRATRRLRRIRRAARSWRRRRRLAWLWREPAYAPAESPIAVCTRDGARCPL